VEASLRSNKPLPVDAAFNGVQMLDRGVTDEVTHNKLRITVQRRRRLVIRYDTRRLLGRRADAEYDGPAVS